MSSGLPRLPDTVWNQDKNISPYFTYSTIRSCSTKFIHHPPRVQRAEMTQGGSFVFTRPLPWSVAAEPWGGRWGAWVRGLSDPAAHPSSSCSSAVPSAGPLPRSASAALWDDQLEPCLDLGRAAWTPQRFKQETRLLVHSFPVFGIKMSEK